MKNIFHSFQEAFIASLFSIMTFFAPAGGILLVVLGFMFFDILIAYFRVKKTGSNWTSRSFIRGFLPKICSYTIIVLLFFMMDKFLLNEFTHFFINIDFLSTKIMSLGLIYAEILSVNESWKKLYGKGLIKYFTDVLGFAKQIKNKIGEINTDKDGEDNRQG